MVNEAIPALTSRFLLLMENEEDLLGLKPKQQVRTTGTTSRLEESKEPDEAPMMFSPCSNNRIGDFNINHQNSSPLWSYLPRFDTIPAHNECGLPNFPPCRLPPNPSTPLSTKGVSLFASFSSSPMSQEPTSMWQYDDKARSPSFLSPRTTDAVWRSPVAHRSNRGSNSNGHHIHKAVTIPNLPPIASSLLLDDIPSGRNHDIPPLPQHHHSHDGPPSIIRCRTSSSSSNMFEFDDDEVSLLADDPDEDDAGVFPPSTYDVLVNILDEIDKDESADGAAIEE